MRYSDPKSSLAYWHEDAASAAPAARHDFTRSGRRVPWVTACLIALFVAIFALEIRFSVTPGSIRYELTPATMLALGGLQRGMILGQDQWYRLLTAAFLHANPTHLIGNGVGIMWAGYTLERHIGHRWFLALFLIGAVSGALVSLAMLDPRTVVVGASGGGLALFAALFVCAFRLPTARRRLFLQGRATVMIVMSLVPTAAHAKGLPVSYASHAGGAIAGLVVILVVAGCWRAEDHLPRFRAVAGGICLIAAVVLALGARSLVAQYSGYQVISSLIPAAQIPKTEAEQLKQAQSLVTGFPRDPRAHLFMARLLQARRDKVGVEQEFRIAFDQVEEHPDLFGKAFNATVRVMLAQAINDNGRHAAAREMAQPFCADAASEPSAFRALAMLKNLKLCD